MHRLRKPLTAVVLLSILAATLHSDYAETRMKMQSLCLACGDRGLADALANVVLFLPLGMLLCTWVSPKWAVALGMLLSAAVELAQTGVPGRDPSMGDVLWNGIGTLIGVLLVASWRSWIHPSRRVARWLTLVWCAGGVFACWLTRWAATPAPPPAAYWGQWTADLGMQVYQGRVLDASVGSEPLPRFRLRNSARVRALLLAGAPISAWAVVGPPPPGLAPILSVYDEYRHEVFLLAADGNDLVFRQATRGSQVRLSAVEVRASGLLARLAGDTVNLVVRSGSGGSHCLSAAGQEVCTRGQGIGDGWKLFAPNWAYSPTQLASLAILWILILLVPVVFWATADAVSLAGIGLLVLGTSSVLATHWLVPPDAAELAGAALALAAGSALRRLAAVRAPERSRPAHPPHEPTEMDDRPDRARRSPATP